MSLADLTLDRGMVAQYLQLAFEARESILHAAAIDFERRFARAARADAAGLAGKVRPHSR